MLEICPLFDQIRQSMKIVTCHCLPWEYICNHWCHLYVKTQTVMFSCHGMMAKINIVDEECIDYTHDNVYIQNKNNLK